MSSTTKRTGWPAELSDRLLARSGSQRTRQPSCCSRYCLTRRPIESSSSTRRRTPPVAASAHSFRIGAAPARPLLSPWLALVRGLRSTSTSWAAPIGGHITTTCQRRASALNGRRCPVDDLGRTRETVIGWKRPSASLQRDLRAVHLGDDAAVEMPVLPVPLVYLGADHAGAEEPPRRSPCAARARGREPERDVESDENAYEEKETPVAHGTYCGRARVRFGVNPR